MIAPRLIVMLEAGYGKVYAFPNTREAYDYANHKVSFRSVQRIELVTPEGTIRALWDASWTPASKAAGLTMPA